MILPATDPATSRPAWRPAAAESKETPQAVRRPRSGHAWPFISRYAERTVPQPARRTPSSDGS
jgi:hypothetical protein